MKHIFYQGGHKVARTITNREDFLALRNSADNLSNVALARMGNAEAKARLVQFAYNDLMPDGKVAGCCHPSDHFFHDIDCYDAAQAAEAKERILSMKDAIGLRMLEKSVGGGWHLVCQRERGKTILENQVRIASLLKLEMDTNCHDLSRVVYSTSGSEEDLVYLDDRLFEESMTEEESAEEYELLKVRVREGREEVPESAKHDQKHYRPWEEEVTLSGSTQGSDPLVTSEISQTGQTPCAAEAREFPKEYHGHTFKEIIDKYWELNNHGFEPTVGDRDAKTYELAYALRHICGNNFDWLDQVIPCYDGFPLEEKRAKIRSALKSNYEGMPRSLTVVLDALEGKSAAEDDSKDETPKPNDFYFNAPQPPELCKHLPKLIRLLTSKVPGPYKAAVASSVFPALGAHLYQTTFKYTDNVEHEATLMDCLVAESGTGKGCIDKPIDHIMADIRERDAVNEKREAEWKEEMNTKGANKDKSKRPEGLIIQEIHGDMTNAALVTRTDEAEGHFLYVKVNEIQMFDALKGNGKAGHQYLVMCLSFDPNNRYGQTRIGTQSVTKTVCLRMNWNACTMHHAQEGEEVFQARLYRRSCAAHQLQHHPPARDRSRPAGVRRLRRHVRRRVEAVYPQSLCIARTHRLSAGHQTGQEVAEGVSGTGCALSEPRVRRSVSSCLRYRLAESLRALRGQRLQVGEEYRGLCTLVAPERPLVQDELLRSDDCRRRRGHLLRDQARASEHAGAAG